MVEHPHVEDFGHARILPADRTWFQRAVFYEVLVRAFYDSNADGSGDLQGLIAKLQLSNDLASGSIVSSTTDPLLAYPTTLAWADGRLLVVNSQFNKRGPGLQPALPFTITSIQAP